MDAKTLSKCWFLTGPTACGKTAASLILAGRLNAEIIAMDSMTLYRGMDIGTAKPNELERSCVRHHLIDILNPEDEFSLAEYVSQATNTCTEILSRGHTPLFVGGTGLYLRGVLRGVFDGPPADWLLRKGLEDLAQREGGTALHRRLQQVDPISAGRLHPNDQRRVIRALEVFELTGAPLSELQQQGPLSEDDRPRHAYWLSPPRDWLHERIDLRVEQMFAHGLVDEVQSLLVRAKPLSHTARQALGYKEVLDWLESTQQTSTELQGSLVDNSDSNAISKPGDSHGKAGSEKAVPSQYGELRPALEATSIKSLVNLIQTRTRQFAKRQETWFRNLEELRAISITGKETAAEIADLITG